MNLEDFKASLSSDAPPGGLRTELQALWYDASGDWEMAHESVQDESTAQAARVHAYLHRKEGDRSNASYWYRRAGCDFPEVSLLKEWDQIATALLKDSG